MPRPRTAAWLTGMMLPVAAVAAGSAPPDLDCSLGFTELQAAAHSLAAANAGGASGFEVIVVEQPDAWRAEFAFTPPTHPAHPAATLRTLRKQVTGVWTAQSKSCGYGNETAFIALVEDAKRRDTELTNASRAEVEQEREGRSPLAPPLP